MRTWKSENRIKSKSGNVWKSVKTCTAHKKPVSQMGLESAAGMAGAFLVVFGVVTSPPRTLPLMKSPVANTHLHKGPPTHHPPCQSQLTAQLPAPLSLLSRNIESGGAAPLPATVSQATFIRSLATAISQIWCSKAPHPSSPPAMGPKYVVQPSPT